MITMIKPNDSDSTGAALPPQISAAILELTDLLPPDVMREIIPDAGVLEAWHIVMCQIPAIMTESAKFGYTDDLTGRWIYGLMITALERLEGRFLPEFHHAFNMVYGGC